MQRLSFPDSPVELGSTWAAERPSDRESKGSEQRTKQVADRIQTGNRSGTNVRPSDVRRADHLDPECCGTCQMLPECCDVPCISIWACLYLLVVVSLPRNKTIHDPSFQRSAKSKTVISVQERLAIWESPNHLTLPMLFYGWTKPISSTSDFMSLAKPGAVLLVLTPQDPQPGAHLSTQAPGLRSR